jgi:hypothetical protein
MSDSQKMRDRATRVFAMAIKTRENGFAEHSDQLARLANEILAHAEEIERHSANVPAAPRSGEER